MEAQATVNFETEKDFPVKKEKLYEAWTTEDGLRQWWKPNGITLQKLTNDIKDGGKVTYVFADDTNEVVFTISGTYEEAKPNEKLVYTWNWDIPAEPVKNAEYKLTIEFKDTENGSRLHVIQEGFNDEESILPHKEGWEKGLRDLDTYLSGKE